MVLNPDAVGQREPKYQPHGSHRSTKAPRAPEASSQWDPPSPFCTLPTLPPPETTMAGRENRQRVGLPVQGRVVGRVGPLRTKRFLRPLLLYRPLREMCREQRAHTSGTSRSPPAPTNFLLSRTAARRPSRQISLGWGRRRSPRSFSHQPCPPWPHCRLEVPGT